MKKHRITIENNKRSWWGGIVSDGILMPYGRQPLARDLEMTETANQCMPFLIAEDGTYIWNELPFKYEFKDNMILLEGDAPFTVTPGNGSIKLGFLDAASKHFLTGYEIPDPMFFERPQYNTWIELMYDQRQERILDYAQNIISEGYPAGVLMIDDNWQEDYGVFDFHEGRFHQPKEMIDSLHKMGFKVILWVSPFVSPDCFSFRDLQERGMLIMEQDSEPVIRKWWNGYSAILDFTNPETCGWFHAKLKSLMDRYGVDGFKFDGGDPSFYRKSNKIFNPCSRQEQSRSYTMIGLSYPLNEFRTSWKAAGLPIVQRLCDKDHCWGNTGLASLIPNAIAQGMMGYNYICPDMIGGGQYKNFLEGELDLDQELVVRYAQCSALFPMMQFSVAPWRILDSVHAALCLEAAMLHLKYGAYILELAKESAKSGIPMLRSIGFEYGSEYTNIKDQFLLGDKIMVAPVLEKGMQIRKVIFPLGTWCDPEGQIIVGPCEMMISAPINVLPYYEKVCE